MYLLVFVVAGPRSPLLAPDRGLLGVEGPLDETLVMAGRTPGIDAGVEVGRSS